MKEQRNSSEKDFLFSTWAITHKTIIYVIMTIFLFLGISAYFTMPRENFPEIKQTNVFLSAAYPGNTAEDVERLITNPLEDAVKGISNLVEITSTSQEDYCIIKLEFDESITVESAKQQVKDNIDAVISGEDWPTFNNAKIEPNVFDLNFSEEMPILNVNIKGDYPTEKLKEIAEILQEKIERLDEIKEVDIRGAQDKEIEVAVDIQKMKASKISFDDIINSIARENTTVAAGNIVSSGLRRTLRVIGEIENPEDLGSFVVKNDNGTVFLKEVAQISFTEKEKTTYAREFGENVVMLDVKKRAGKNLIEAVNKIIEMVTYSKENIFSNNLEISISNDQSMLTINQVNDLVNNILFGVLLVVTVLMFFLGFRNALFVGFAIPMSMFMSLMVLQALGYTLNTMVLFALVMGLGMLVDNGIVVVENVYRLMEKEGMSRVEAAKKGVAEIAYPIIVSTATTIAAFIPLGMWPGTMGEFMIYFPITLSIVLGSSLVVAIFFNSMLVSRFMEIEERSISLKGLIRLTYTMGLFGLLLIFAGGVWSGFGTLFLCVVGLVWLYKYYIKKWAAFFQFQFLVTLENRYEKVLAFAMRGWRAYAFLGGTILLLLLTFVIVGIASPKVEFFPDNQPNQIIVYIEYPQGTDIEKTNSITKKIEKDVFSVINDPLYLENNYNYMVESVVSQVGAGAGNPETDSGSEADMPHKAKITATMREFKFRRGQSSEELRQKIQAQLNGKFAGVSISVEKDANGPPSGYPVNIEINGLYYDELIVTAENIRAFINNQNIAGIEELKIDVNRNKPGMRIEIDREKAGALGLSAGQIGRQLRRSLFGEKASVYKSGGEDYDINVRFQDQDRYNPSALFNQNITFRDQASGKIKEIPVAAVVSQQNIVSYSAIKHRGLKRVVTVYSSILPGYNAVEIVNQLKVRLKDFTELPQDVNYSFTGEIEKQDENMAFLSRALGLALMLIMLLLVFQFNSITKPAIILLSIFLSFIGVFLGLVIFNMTFVIIMTMMGIISLAGIVVNNSVVLLDYTQLLLDRRRKNNGLASEQLLPKEEIFQAVINGGKARLRPVLLTAITTILGLIPLAIGLNINFFSLFMEGNPQIYIGGDNVIFWGPLAWTVIFGLTFATFLTLIIVPVTFYLSKRAAIRIKNLTL
ncbi:MAG: efflux RND transporter permease subunit [Flavobacteriaceae bacterium]|nr:efflux RND transporter permease subunit [Flavobacteriaceae bacterium]MDG2314590.1 efflux RND transporter permease subunit [Flavobacteriaceae bacterium]